MSSGHNYKLSTFQGLFDNDKSVAIHNRNLQILATEMFKVTRGFARDIFSSVFNITN